MPPAILLDKNALPIVSVKQPYRMLRHDVMHHCQSMGTEPQWLVCKPQEHVFLLNKIFQTQMPCHFIKTTSVNGIYAPQYGG